MPDEVTLDYEPSVLRVLQTKSETKAFYDKIAKVYDLLSEHSERPMREAGLNLLAAAPGEHVLEIGFGTGHILVELAKAVGPTGTVFGIDISENMLAHAIDVLSNEGLIDRIRSVLAMLKAFPMAMVRWMGYSCALPWNCSTRPIFLRCWWNVNECYDSVDASWSWPCPRRASRGSSSKPLSGLIGTFPT